MKDNDFAKLVTSIRQAGLIRRGKIRPGRATKFARLKAKPKPRRAGKSR
jgi:hypothetical protein